MVGSFFTAQNLLFSMLSYPVALLEEITEKEIKSCGLLGRRLRQISQVVSLPPTSVVAYPVFQQWKKDGRISWQTEMEISSIYKKIGGGVVSVWPSPSYERPEIEGSLANSNLELLSRITQLSRKFLSDEEEDHRKGREIKEFDLAFVIQSVLDTPHSGSTSVHISDNKAEIYAVHGQFVDREGADFYSLSLDGKTVERKPSIQEKMWLCDEKGLKATQIEESLKSQEKLSEEDIPKLLEICRRMKKKIEGDFRFTWLRRGKIFYVSFVFPVTGAEEGRETKVEEAKAILIPEMRVFLDGRGLRDFEKVLEKPIQGILPIGLDDLAEGRRGKEAVEALKSSMVTLLPSLRPRPIGILIERREDLPLLLKALSDVKPNQEPNLWLVLSGVRTTEDFEELSSVLKDAGLGKEKYLSHWLFLSRPADLFMVRALSQDCDGFLLDMESLAMDLGGSYPVLEAVGDFAEKTSSMGKPLGVCLGPKDLKMIVSGLAEMGVSIISAREEQFEEVYEVLEGLKGER